MPHLSVEFEDFHIADAALVQVEAEGGADHVEALDAGCSRVDDQHISFGIPHHFKDMRVAADKDVRMEFIDQLPRAGVISAGIASDVGHKHLHPLTFKEAVERVSETEVVVVAVSSNTYKGLEFRDGSGKIKASAEVTGVPDFVHRGKEFAEFGAEDAVGVGY